MWTRVPHTGVFLPFGTIGGTFRTFRLHTPGVYTKSMDSVRFGRVLGIGTRLAGKTLVQAVDAATAPNPNGPTTPDGPSPSRPEPPAQGVVIPPARARVETAARQARATSQGVARGSRKFGDAVWGPVARASGVLWLEVTGVFFGLIALFGLQGMWTNRFAFRATASHTDHQHLLLETALAVVFGYFCASSFIRASRRSRRA
ncbi:hypothetical protein [Granulicella sibirica]|uniref:Uncharacterized protein n=1 Tax=Granulicella sibirica TaxID=2479048 RepID=A0A4Q0T4W1_9BACT|nr:hypothetical protein [Granulicella sibirica]RXH57630.1 hypothetical protein GRAN_0940 [Granulicella sibirica]